MELLVITVNGWGYTNGGINVFNREMCRGLGTFVSSQLKVLCVAPGILQHEADEVRENENIILISVREKEFNDPSAIVDRIRDYCKKENIVDPSVTWLGHDTYSDMQAIGCRDLWKGSKCAIIHHMSYSTYYPLLNTDSTESEEKENNQKKRLSSANIVFANGPVLTKSANDLCRGKKDVCEILPGVFEVKSLDDYVSDSFNIVTFGRIELQRGNKRSNSIIKQIFLAVAAWAKFTSGLKSDDVSTMKIYGKNSDETDTVINDLISKHACGIHSFKTIPYESDHQKLLESLSSFSLCLVLSTKEGFGLTALEAISAGVPIIISESSGFYMALKEKELDGYVYHLHIEGSLNEPYYSENDLKNVTAKIQEVFYDRENAKKKALKLREELIKNGFTWENCANTILEKLGLIEEPKKSESLSLPERFLVGNDIGSMNNADKNTINEAFLEAQHYYSEYLIPYNSESPQYDRRLFQNNVNPSFRFLCAQEAGMGCCEFITQFEWLNIVDAVYHGCDYRKCIPDTYNYDDQQLDYIIGLAKMHQMQLSSHTIPDDEINQYSLIALLRNGYDFDELCEKQYDIDSLVRFGVKKEILLAYYSEEDVETAFRRAIDLFNIIESPALGKYEKFGPLYLSKRFDAGSVMKVFLVDEFYHAYKISDIIEANSFVSPKSLRKGQYSAAELVINGFSLRQLEAAGFKTEGLNEIEGEKESVDDINSFALISDLYYELEEEEHIDDFLCKSIDAEVLRRLKLEGIPLNKIRNDLPYWLDSSPICVKWLLMARFTVDEIESVGIDWKSYLSLLPTDCIMYSDVEIYQYDGVLPIELMKAGVSPDWIKSVYDTKEYYSQIENSKALDVHTLRKQGFTAKAFYYMEKPLKELLEEYSPKSQKDICEMALSYYELKDLRNAGFIPGTLKKEYERVLREYGLLTNFSYRKEQISDFISKHGEY